MFTSPSTNYIITHLDTNHLNSGQLLVHKNKIKPCKFLRRRWVRRSKSSESLVHLHHETIMHIISHVLLQANEDLRL